MDLQQLCEAAVALHGQKRYDEALAAYDRALALDPGLAEILYNRGNALVSLERYDEALASFDRAIAARPGYAKALYNRANTLRALARVEEAVEAFDLLLAVDPGFAEGWNNRGIALRILKRFDEAVASFDRAIVLRPDYARALYNRGNIEWIEHRHIEPALADIEKAAALDPDCEYVLGDLLHLRMHVGAWDDFDRQLARIDAGVRAGRRTAQPFIYQALSESPADLLACAKIYSDYRFPAGPALWKPRDRGHKKIRLGYLSGEFRDQATAHLAAGLYELHDREQFEVVAFDNGSGDGSLMRRRLEAGFDKFIDIASLGDRAAAEKILAEEIDILVNLNGYFGDFRMGVFAARPAPIQVNYLGFPATLGAPYIDYILADRIVIPENERQFYSEQVVWLPDSYQVNDSKRAIAAAAPTRAEAGLPDTGFVFANFNQSYKLLPATFAIWARILKQVDGSVLWLLENNPTFPKNLAREAERHGIDPARLVFAPMIAPDKHLARLALADLFLDSLPYNAHTTASDALWAGVPLLTLKGRAFPGRVAASLLNAIGLPELITETPEDYEQLAVTLARDPAQLKSIREKLARNRLTTPLFDTDRFRRNIESAYKTMWEIAQRDEKPKAFAV